MIINVIVQTVIWFGVMGTVLFLGAGTLDWPAAWVFLGEMVAISVLGSWGLARHDPGLLAERLKPPVQKAQPLADKILMSLFMILMFAWLALMGLDAVRLHRSSMPMWLQIIGGIGLLASIWVCFRTMLENSFAAPVVKIQEDRGQRVISTGPYAYVRHPMYVGASFYFLSIGLLLGSWWGFAAAFILIGILCIRIPIEEKTLRAGLRGYDDYAERVRYRLMPLVW